MPSSDGMGISTRQPLGFQVGKAPALGRFQVGDAVGAAGLGQVQHIGFDAFIFNSNTPPPPNLFSFCFTSSASFLPTYFFRYQNVLLDNLINKINHFNYNLYNSWPQVIKSWERDK